jgi:hypothetical protein
MISKREESAKARVKGTMSFLQEPIFEWGVILAILASSGIASLVFLAITKNEKMED